MIQNKLHRICLMVILLLIHPVIMADDWKDLHKDLDKDFLEYVDTAKIDEATKKKHTELTERLCKIHEQGAKSNKVFEIMRYYEQFDPEPDVKLDLVLTKLWFDGLKGWYIASNTLISNLLLIDPEWSKEHQKTEDYFIDELPKKFKNFESSYYKDVGNSIDNYIVPYCDNLLKKSGKKYFNIINFKLLDKHDPITKLVSWFTKVEYYYNAFDYWVKELKSILPDNFPDVWLNSLMEYADFQKKFSKTQKKLEQLLNFYNNQKNSNPKALEYLRRLKNTQLSEYKKLDNKLRKILFSWPVIFYVAYINRQYNNADSLIWFDDRYTMRNAAMQLSKLTPFIPYLNEPTLKWLMETQRMFKDKFGEKEYADIVTESKLLPNNWADVFKKLTPP
ncbi:hypothetical protein QUF74_01385 [Candidatus Halobeggiatoa sp. HSG11]|nr:hypothetical protein [Candidatus Halobeggiatoa sp. HSG11]